MKTKEDIRNEIIDAMIYFVRRKEGIYFDFRIDDETLVICPCSYYSPEQLIEHLYTGDMVECFDYYLVFTERNEHNFGSPTLDGLVDKLFDYSKDVAKMQKAKEALQKYYDKHRYDYDFNEEYFNKEYFMLFGYMPGKKFGKSAHESVRFTVFIDFYDIDAKTLSTLKECVKRNDFRDLYEYCPDIAECQLYEDPDLPSVQISGILLDEMLSEDLFALEKKEFDQVEDIRVIVE